MGVWIEIDREAFDKSREDVTPFMGVWIEIGNRFRSKSGSKSHSLYGSVD